MNSAEPSVRHPPESPVRRVVAALLLCAALAGSLTGLTGCESLRHEMQFHRRQRWNYGPGMPGGSEAYSSRAVRTDAVCS